MATLKTMRVTLYPVEATEFGFRMTIGIGTGVPGRRNFETEVTTPEEMEAFVAECLARATPDYGTETFPANAWRVDVEPASGRWAPGWKARFEKNWTVRYDEVPA
jgi:hypothetical protein